MKKILAWSLYSYFYYRAYRFYLLNFQLFEVLNFAEGKVIELYAKHTNCANQLE
jgi:hypothetical protein